MKDMKNIFLLNGIEFHERFFRCLEEKKEKHFLELKTDIINDLNNKEDNLNFYIDSNVMELDEDMFNFVNFKEKGKWKVKFSV